MATIAGLMGRLELDTRPYEQALGRAERATEGFGGTVQRIVRRALELTAVVAIYRQIQAAFSGAQDAIFGMNSTLETSTLQFKILMKDADLAKAHVKDLFDIAKETPFETGPILQASRLFQTMGGAALNTKENILLVGDAAATAGREINEVAYYVGRMFASIQSGASFGESLERFREMGVVSSETMAQLMRISETRQDMGRAWELLTEDFRKNSGAMKELAGTWKGVTSTFEDTKNILQSQVTRPIFEAFRDMLANINDALGQNEVEEWANRIAAHIAVIIKAFGVLGQIVVASVTAMAQTLATLGPMIYQALQWINPFARHSDPLVTQVERGVDQMIAKYQELDEISGVLVNVGGQVQRFESVTAAAMAVAAQKTLDLKMISLSYLGKDIPQAYAVAIGSIQDMNMELAGMREQIMAQREVVEVWERQLEDASDAVQAKEREIRGLERSLRPLTDALRDAQDAQRPYTDLVKMAQREIEIYKGQIADVSDTLQPYRDRLQSLNDLVEDQQRVVSGAQRALQPYRNQLEDLNTTSSRLSDQLSQVRDQINRLNETPVAGTEKFRAQLQTIEDQSNKVRLQLAQMGAAGITSGAGVETLRQQLSRLQAQAESVRLRETMELGPQRRAIAEALNPRRPEQPGEKLLAEAQRLGPARVGMEEQLRVLKQQIDSVKQQEIPFVDALRAEERTLSTLQTARDRARDNLADQERILRPMNEHLRRLEANLRAAESAERPFRIETELAADAVERETDAILRLPRRELEDLKDIQQDIRDTLEEHQRPLQRLEAAYGAITQQVERWENGLEKVVSAGEKLKAEADKVKAGPPDVPATPGATAEQIAEAQRKSAEEAAKWSAKIEEAEGNLRPVLNAMDQLAVLAGVKNTEAVTTLNAAIAGVVEQGALVAHNMEIAESLIPGSWGAMAEALGFVDDELGSAAEKLREAVEAGDVHVLSEQWDYFNERVMGTARESGIARNELVELLDDVRERMAPVGRFFDMLGGVAPVLLAIGAGFATWAVLSSVGVAIPPIILGIATLVGLVGPLGFLAVAIGALLSPITLISIAVGLLVLAWVNDWGGIQEKTQAVWDTISPIFSAIGEWLGEKLPIAGEFLGSAFETLGTFISGPFASKLGDIWNFMETKLGPILRTIGQIAIEVVLLRFMTLWNWAEATFLPGLRTVGQFLYDHVISKLIDVGKAFLDMKLKDITGGFNALGEAFKFLSEWAGKFFEWLGRGIPVWFQFILDNLEKLRGLLQDMNKAQSPSAQAEVERQRELMRQGYRTEPLAAYASGGRATGGLALVGEKGPELVELPAGSYVHPHGEIPHFALGGWFDRPFVEAQTMGPDNPIWAMADSFEHLPPAINATVSKLEDATSLLGSGVIGPLGDAADKIASVADALAPVAAGAGGGVPGVATGPTIAEMLTGPGSSYFEGPNAPAYQYQSGFGGLYGYEDKVTDPRFKSNLAAPASNAYYEGTAPMNVNITITGMGETVDSVARQVERRIQESTRQRSHGSGTTR